MHSIREGHERLLEGLEGMTERATRYGNEANALHVALEASDAIVDEYEREVQVQEEVQGGLQLQLMSMTSQDQRHEEELHECRLRFLDMKRMYNQVHAHLAVLVHTSTDKMMLNTAPRDAFASHVSVENSVIKREQVAEAPHPHMSNTPSSAWARAGSTHGCSGSGPTIRVVRHYACLREVRCAAIHSWLTVVLWDHTEAVAVAASTACPGQVVISVLFPTVLPHDATCAGVASMNSPHLQKVLPAMVL